MGIIFDDSAFQADYRRELAALRREGQANVKFRANRIANRAKELVHVLSGETRESIHVTGSGDEYTVRADAPQAVYEEFGTSDAPAIPFLRPAAAEER